MKLLFSLSTSFVVLFMAVLASAATTTKPTIVPTGSATWSAVPGMAGLSQAVLYGTPSKAGSGIYIERLKASSDVTFPVHWHPNTEAVTVLSGTLTVGFGDQVNWASATTLAIGGFVGIPGGVHHFGRLRAGSVVQISGLAPDTMNVVKSGNSSM